MSRERILAIGAPGTGKTLAWMKIADFVSSTDTKRRFYVIDTDDTVERMLEGKQFEELRGAGVRYISGNEGEGGIRLGDQSSYLTVFRAHSWSMYMAAMHTIVKAAKEGDWIVVDMVDEAWKAVQRYFVSEVFKDSIGGYFLEARKILAQQGDKTAKGKDVKTLQAFDGWLDWVVINKMYDDWILPLIFQTPAHIYAVGKAKAMSKDDSEPIKELYGIHGVKSDGQKNLGHQFHTVLLFSQKTEWQLTTIKDRERPKMDHMKLTNFPVQYLVARAKFPMEG